MVPPWVTTKRQDASQPLGMLWHLEHCLNVSREKSTEQNHSSQPDCMHTDLCGSLFRSAYSQISLQKFWIKTWSWSKVVVRVCIANVHKDTFQESQVPSEHLLQESLLHVNRLIWSRTSCFWIHLYHSLSCQHFTSPFVMHI